MACNVGYSLVEFKLCASEQVCVNMSSNISFALNLQSESGQRAIHNRLENELRCLEGLKKFLVSQIKAGKEYSTSINHSTTTALKSLAAITLSNGYTNGDGSSNGGHGGQANGFLPAQGSPRIPPAATANNANNASSAAEGSAGQNLLSASNANTNGGSCFDHEDNEGNKSPSRCGSPIQQSPGVVNKMCLHVLEQVGMSAVNVKQSVQFLNGTTLKQLNELIQDKKLLIKGTQEEFQKIKARLDQVKTI